MERSSTNNLARFSFFSRPITNTRPASNFSLADAYSYITGADAKRTTAMLRQINDVKQARLFKAANFDYCTFSGTFRYRNDKALIEHSGFLCLDFDHLPNWDEVRSNLLSDGFFETQLLFRSPSGDGLKWIIKIDIISTSHADYFRAVANYLKQTYNVDVDQSGKDVSRACFLPYDPDCYINPKNL